MLVLGQMMPARGFGVPESQWELVDWQRKRVSGPDGDEYVPDITRHYVQPRTAYAATAFRRLQRLLRVQVDGVLGYKTGQAVARLGFPDLSHPIMMALSAEWLSDLIETSLYFRQRVASLGDDSGDIVPETRVAKWVPLLAVTGLLAVVVGVAAIKIATTKVR